MRAPSTPCEARSYLRRLLAQNLKAGAVTGMIAAALILPSPAGADGSEPPIVQRSRPECAAQPPMRTTIVGDAALTPVLYEHGQLWPHAVICSRVEDPAQARFFLAGNGGNRQLPPTEVQLAARTTGPSGPITLFRFVGTSAEQVKAAAPAPGQVHPNLVMATPPDRAAHSRGFLDGLIGWLEGIWKKFEAWLDKQLEQLRIEVTLEEGEWRVKATH